MAANTSTTTSLNCIFCGNHLFDSPRQAPCGDRLCGACYCNFQSSGKEELRCPNCGSMINLSLCFRDKAADVELASAVLHCSNKGCPWEGQSSNLKMHYQMCKFSIVECPNMGNGCREKMYRSDVDMHLKNCQYKEAALWQKEHHGSSEEIQVHSMQLMKNRKEDFELVSQTVDAKVERKFAVFLSQFEQLKSELNSRVWPAVQGVTKMEAAVQQLQDGFGEMALLIQTLQATSYNGVFIWKIPEVHRRRQEAKMGRTISLYSAPFYTSRHGYKLCLRLYMDGDGSGKGTHLSFFLTLMKGEFDALLSWPFKQTVSLILLDQDRQKDVIQSFKPEPSSASFQRPRLQEMNVASGCPNFAPLSVLKNSSYVKDDTMFLKCVVGQI